MDHPVNVFIATSVVLWLLYRAVAIVRESAADAARSTPASRPFSSAVLDGTLKATGRIAVLLGTALAITCAITLAQRASTLPAPKPVSQAEIIRLEPVVVTISAERFTAIHAEAERETLLATRPQKIRS
jgi:hypothetical protein